MLFLVSFCADRSFGSAAFLFEGLRVEDTFTLAHYVRIQAMFATMTMVALRRRKESRLSCMSYESHLFGCSEKSLLEIDSLKEPNRPVLAPLEEAARDTPKNTRTLDGMLKPIQSRILQRRRGSV